MITVLLVTS